MKSLVGVLLFLFVLLQYKLWFDGGGVRHAWRLQKSVEKQAAQNNQLKQRNVILSAEVKNLKQGKEAIEERARNELGMVKKGETFYQIIDQ